MSNFLQQIYNILTTYPGNLIYHLVLTFAIAIAFLVVWIQRRPSDPTAERRVIIGLSILFVSRLATFILAGLAWQGLLNEHLLLPPIDRAITLLTILVLVWLWAFPLPSRPADAATWLLGLLLAVFYVFSMVWWIESGSQIYYNGTWPDLTAQIAGAVLLAFGCIFLYVRRPGGWGFGQAMLLVLLAGTVLYLISLPSDGDYPAPVRLAQMIAFPLLPALVLHIPQVATPRQAMTQAPAQERRTTINDPALIQSLMALSVEKDLARIAQVITQAISSAVPAEVCLLVSPPDEEDNLNVYCGYDQLRERLLEGFTIRGQTIPNVTSAIQDGVEQSLSADSMAPDPGALSKALKLGQTGGLHAAPILADSGEPLAGVVLLSPYSRRGWSSAERQVLISLLPPVAHLLQRTQVLEELLTELEKTRQTLKENADEMEWVQGGTDATTQYTEPAAVIPKGAVLPLPIGIDTDYVEGELRLALEEIARLNSALSDADQQILNMQNQMDTSRLLGDHNQAFIGTIQELRQSMAAVIGYTDFVLAESVGILGGMQRKFLERVKVSTERMNRLVENLVSMTSIKDGRHLIKFEPVDMKEVISEAIANTADLFRERSISLKLDLPDEAPQLETDRVALLQMVTNLLENAAQATPPQGEVGLRAALENDDQERSYYLIQITDRGGGIAVADIPHVFSRIPHGEKGAIAGLGSDSQQMAIVKRLVEALEGRIWVDSVPKAGATFSILLPTDQVQATVDAEPGGLDV
jgi:signal transduction histidine kinase